MDSTLDVFVIQIHTGQDEVNVNTEEYFRILGGALGFDQRFTAAQILSRLA